MNPNTVLTHATPIDEIQKLGDMHVPCNFSFDCASRLKRALLERGWEGRTFDQIPATILTREAHHAIRDEPTPEPEREAEWRA